MMAWITVTSVAYKVEAIFNNHACPQYYDIFYTMSVSIYSHCDFVSKKIYNGSRPSGIFSNPPYRNAQI